MPGMHSLEPTKSELGNPVVSVRPNVSSSKMPGMRSVEFTKNELGNPSVSSRVSGSGPLVKSQSSGRRSSRFGAALAAGPNALFLSPASDSVRFVPK